jgi:uncharacterized membrane protein YfcA
MFDAVVIFGAIVSSSIAAVTGFGIGSIMTPLLSLQVELKLAVALVSIPHFVATAERFWRLRKNVDRGVILSFECPRQKKLVLDSSHDPYLLGPFGE